MTWRTDKVAEETGCVAASHSILDSVAAGSPSLRQGCTEKAGLTSQLFLSLPLNCTLSADSSQYDIHPVSPSQEVRSAALEQIIPSYVIPSSPSTVMA
jgi:hypothetical protein